MAAFMRDFGSNLLGESVAMTKTSRVAGLVALVARVRRTGAICSGAAGRDHPTAGRPFHYKELPARPQDWNDKRYTRCNTPRQLTDTWAQHKGARGATAASTARQ